jgi:hypothetical protein
VEDTKQVMIGEINILQLRCKLKISLTLVIGELRTTFPLKYLLPFKKKRKSEVSDEEKKYNRKHSKLRYTVSRIKKFGIMGTKFRNKLERYDHASDIVSGLVNFRIKRTNRMLLQNRITLYHDKQIFFSNYAMGLVKMPYFLLSLLSPQKMCRNT